MGTLSGELKQRVLDNQRAKAVSAVKAGRKIIIVGAMYGNIQPALAEHPFVEIWQGDNGVRSRHIPDSAGIVMHTRFVSHPDLERLRSEAHRKDIDFYPQPFTTGELREILEPLVPAETETTWTAPVIEPTRPTTEVVAEPVEKKESEQVVMRTKPGALKRFIAQHARFDSPSDVAEVNRLYPMVVVAHGLGAVTRGSVLTAYRVARRLRGLPPRRKGNFKGRMTGPDRAVPPPVAPPVVARAEVMLKHGKALAVPVAMSGHNDVLQLFDEAASFMQQGVAAVQLAKERYIALVDAHKTTDETKARLKALLETL